MAHKTFEVAQYFVAINSKMLQNSAIGDHAAIPAQAMLVLQGKNGESLSVFFLNDNRNLPKTHSDEWPNRTLLNASQSVGEIFAPMEQYVVYLDLVRNEKPLLATIDDAQPMFNRITCTRPAGHGDFS